MSAPAGPATARRWPPDHDVTVVGAGPAGTVAARRLGLEGHDVVLLERARLPRRKVCGGCLGPTAVAGLRAEGLGHLIPDLGARRLHRLELLAPGARAVLPLRGHFAVARATLDRALAEEARRVGVLLHTGRAVRTVDRTGGRVTCWTDTGPVRSRALVDATGLSGTLAPRGPRDRFQVDPDSCLGAGAMWDGSATALPPGTLRMVTGAPGYVGLVRVEDGRLNVAAALRPEAVARVGVEEAVFEILRAAGAELPVGPPVEGWQGTPALTRTRARLQAGRVLRVGDAAGYVEPFTGEGMGWAIAGGSRVARHVRAVLEGPDRATGEGWTGEHARSVGARQRTCTLIARGLRSPRLTRMAVSALARAPRLATPFLRATARPLGARVEPGTDTRLGVHT